MGILVASLRPGGAERASLGLLDALEAAGADPYLLTVDRDHDLIAASDPGRAAALAGRVLRLSGSRIRWSTASKVLISPRQWLGLRRAVRRLDLDVVLSVMERANILNLLSAGPQRRILSVRSFHSSHLAQKTAFKRMLVVLAYRVLLRRADRVVLVSREAADDFERLFPSVRGRTTVIYNACDVARLRAAGQHRMPEGIGGRPEEPLVVTVGRLSPEKGHWHLLRAFREVCRGEEPGRLVIVGTGPMESDLKRLTDEMGIAERVQFAGFRPNPMPIVARASVFVLPSLREGFPNALLEAMAVGTPVISSDCRSGPRELLAPESDPTRKTTGVDVTPYGTLVAPLDGIRRPAPAPPSREERLLADAIRAVLRSPETARARARAGLERAEDFAPERVVPRWLDLLDEATASPLASRRAARS